MPEHNEPAEPQGRFTERVRERFREPVNRSSAIAAASLAVTITLAVSALGMRYFVASIDLSIAKHVLADGKGFQQLSDALNSAVAANGSRIDVLEEKCSAHTRWEQGADERIERINDALSVWRQNCSSKQARLEQAIEDNRGTIDWIRRSYGMGAPPLATSPSAVVPVRPKAP